MRIKPRPGIFLTAFFFLVLLGGVLTAGQWQYHARAFPWVIGIPALLLCVAQLASELFPAKGPGTIDDTAGLMDLPVDRSVPVSIVVRRAVNIFGWILGFFFVIWLLGFILAVPLFVFSYLTIQAREKIWVALIYMAVMLLFLLGVFHYVLHIPWPEGMIATPQDVILGWIGE